MTNAKRDAKRALGDTASDARLGAIAVAVESKAKRKDFDSSLDTISGEAGDPQVNTVRTRTGNDPGPAFWNRADVQADLDRLKASGEGLDAARRLVLVQYRLDGRAP